jgi:pyruvate dehydrogenase E1 component beta subunit
MLKVARSQKSGILKLLYMHYKEGKQLREITFVEAVREAMCQEMRRDDAVFLIGEDIGLYGGAFGVSMGMLEEFGPERIMEPPISETAFVGAGVGAAMMGMRPIVELMFSDFAAVCFDQIINQAAKLHFMFGGKTDVPMVIRASHGGGTGAAAQHSQSLENLFCHIPGLKVVVPSTPYDAKGLLITSIRDNNPVVFLETKLLYGTKGEVPDGEYSIPLGVADIKREGKDITIITYGRTVQMSLEVAVLLENEGISVEVLDLRSLYPLDRESVIRTAAKTGRVVVVHEAVLFGGFGGEIVSTIIESDAFSKLKAPVKRVGALHSPIPFNKGLESQVLPSAERIEAAVRSILY